MFFTKVAAVVAWLAFVLGALRALMAFALAYGGDQAAAAMYLGRKTTGQAIDQGIYTMLFGVALGVAVEISRVLHAGRREE